MENNHNYIIEKFEMNKNIIKALLPLSIREHFILAFYYGSFVYKTMSEKSDRDIIVIVDDDFSEYDILEYKVDNVDFQIITNKKFLEMIENHHIIALESMWLSEDNYTDNTLFNTLYKSKFILDKWKLRQTISSICNNSWAKCHKKLTVEKDFDQYKAQKSIFHVLRLFTFGIQIGKFDRIIDYSKANHYWNDIKEMGIDWNEYKEKYKPLYNSLRSEMVKYCPKSI